MRPTPPQPPETPPVVSGTSILIFSVFLIGVTIGRGVGGELSPYVLTCGLAGMLAFMGLELAHARRRERRLLKERRELVARLKRHLASVAADEPQNTPWPASSADGGSVPSREVAQVAD